MYHGVVKTLQIYLADLKELLEQNEFVSARTCLKSISPIDLAEAWEHFTNEQRPVLFRLCNRQRAVQLFEELDSPMQAELLSSLHNEDARTLLEDIDPSEAGRMMRGLPQPLVRQLDAIMKKGGSETIQKYLQYPEKTVGALMRGRFLTLDPKWNCRQALERIQLSTRLRHIEETYLDILMLADPDGRFLGTVPLKSMVVAPRDMIIGELMQSSPVTLTPEMDQEEAVKLFTRYKLKSAPVLGTDGRLLGVVVYKDIFEAASEETEEDFAKLVGVETTDLSRDVFATVKLRLPWLVVTCVGGLLVSAVVKRFEWTLSQIVALAAFSPLIAGMGGNVGSQTATVIVRSLATGELKHGRERSVIVREISVGIVMGLFYALVVGVSAFLLYGQRYGIRFSLVVSAAMLVSITVAAAGASIQPILLKRFGIDPATAAGPLITTFTDLLSNVVYFTLATYILLH